MTHTPWKPDVDLEATFAIDGRTETVIEITNQDHSETFAYAVPGYENIVAAAPDLLAAAVEIIKHLDADDISIYDNEIRDYCAGSDIVGFAELQAAIARAKGETDG